MISQRTSGLNAVLVLCQLVLTVGAFSGRKSACVLVVYGHGRDRGSWHDYVVYSAVILVGIAAGDPQQQAPGIRHRSPRFHRRPSPEPFRQTLVRRGIVVCLHGRHAGPGTHSRDVRGDFHPLAVTCLLLLTNRFPTAVARANVFSPRNVGKKPSWSDAWRGAEALRPWLDRKADVGFRTVGIPLRRRSVGTGKMRLIPASGRHSPDGGGRAAVRHHAGHPHGNARDRRTNSISSWKRATSSACACSSWQTCLNAGAAR